MSVFWKFGSYLHHLLMNKLYTFLFFALLVPFLAVQGQAITLSLDPCGIDATGNAWDLKKLQTPLSHSGASTINVAWERVLVDIPAEWATAVCDPNQCYSPFSDEPLGPGSVLIPFTMTSGQTISGEGFYVQFQPNGVPGSGTVRLKVYEVGNPNNSIICSFEFDAVATGLSSPSASSFQFNPNPVRNEIRVSAPANAKIRMVEIYSVVGKLVRRYDLGSERSTFQLDLSELKEGMYFARMLNGSNDLVESKRFSKVN